MVLSETTSILVPVLVQQVHSTWFHMSVAAGCDSVDSIDGLFRDLFLFGVFFLRKCLRDPSESSSPAEVTRRGTSGTVSPSPSQPLCKPILDSRSYQRTASEVARGATPATPPGVGLNSGKIMAHRDRITRISNLSR